MSKDKKPFLSNEEIIHDLWIERELRIAATEPTSLLIAWVCVPAWSLWQALGPQNVRNIEEGLISRPLAIVASPILFLSLLAASVASIMSILSQIFLPTTIRNTPTDELAKFKLQRTVRTRTRIVYLLQMTSCVLYQVVVLSAWVLDRSSCSTFDLAPFVYMFAVTGIMWPTLILSPYHDASV